MEAVESTNLTFTTISTMTSTQITSEISWLKILKFTSVSTHDLPLFKIQLHNSKHCVCTDVRLYKHFALVLLVLFNLMIVFIEGILVKAHVEDLRVRPLVDLPHPASFAHVALVIATAL